MTRFHKLFVSKVFAVLLTFLLSYGSFSWGNQRSAGDSFDSALKEYHSGNYEKAVVKLELILSSTEEVIPTFKAKVYFLLGACYENTGKKEKARGCFLELKRMLDGGIIEQVAEVPGVEPESLSEYREVFAEKSHFEFKKPVDVSEMLRKNVVHAPRKSKEQKEKEKKKKKFPWLIAVGAVVIIGTAVVLLLTSKKVPDKIRIPDIEWVKIPAGEFLMGDNFNEGEADELPMHQVYLDEYYISKFEVTRTHYINFCEATGRVYEWPRVNRPVIDVSWYDAKAFCDWFSEVTNQNIHLPTEAQWEKAARGTYQYLYPWGNSPPDPDKCIYSNSTSCIPSTARETLRPDGQSPYGIYDMAGNAAEWCQDWYSSSYYSVSPEKNPTGPANGSFRVLRGGSCRSEAEGIRSANRDFVNPNDRERFIGFRIVKEE